LIFLLAVEGNLMNSRTVRLTGALLGLVVLLGAFGAMAEEPAFDADLALELGADEYGMRSYVFCVLKTGSADITDEDERSEIFRGHFSNMSRLAADGMLVLAGPFVDADPKRGLYIFNVTTIAEAEELVKTDPAVAAGIFDYELTQLYCSAALMKISELHGVIQKTKIE
jgi:uncharacterized protein YciI